MMNNTEIKKTAKENLHKNFGTYVLAEVLDCVAASVGTLIPFGGLVLAGPVAVGKNEIYIKGSDQESPQMESMLVGFQENFVENFLLALLKELFVFLWSLLFVIPGIVKSYSYAMATYLITRNKNMTAMEALKESERRMKGHKFEFFLLHLSFFGWVLLTIVTCGLAGFYAIPYMNAAEIEFFQQLDR